jgi:hypothetical protein
MPYFGRNIEIVQFSVDFQQASNNRRSTTGEQQQASNNRRSHGRIRPLRWFFTETPRTGYTTASCLPLYAKTSPLVQYLSLFPDAGSHKQRRPIKLS